MQEPHVFLLRDSPKQEMSLIQASVLCMVRETYDCQGHGCFPWGAVPIEVAVSSWQWMGFTHCPLPIVDSAKVEGPCHCPVPMPMTGGTGCPYPLMGGIV